MSLTFDRERLLDETGCALLAALQENARMPFSELGRRVNLSAPAVAERLRRMEDAGIVRGYRVLLSPAALGLRLQAYIRITVRYGLYDAFATQLHDMPEVLNADRVTGEDCYVLKVAVRDVEHLERVINAINRYGEPVTSIILSSKIEDRPLLPS
ncbi:Lrp/AsnC family transcriptional regulator [Deinococcus ruber]|uniref:AsnC family transcriptional regulator n=1 Tax=Deinococcus ruber TaxID=1848197 RepID=A0A918F0K3_9DEIO|nr:Lrp/AsnC family transcriptional regulator [Deinococcus ruber]GGQ96840.1 AsnC family transcriptional regulator [Deinococcus ruber]